MRIEGPKSPNVGKARKPGTASPSGTAFTAALDDHIPAASSPPGMTGAGPLAAVDAVLSLQGVGTASDGRSKGVAQAEEMLKALEQLQRGLVMGIIPASRMQAALQSVNQQRTGFEDPKLAQILNDIELRLRVELAKLGISPP